MHINKIPLILEGKKKTNKQIKRKRKKKKPRDILNKSVVSLGSILESTLTIQSAYLGARVGQSAASCDSLFLSRQGVIL